MSTVPQNVGFQDAYADQTRGYQLIVVTAVFGGFALLTVAGRFAARIVSKNYVGLDDWLAGGAMFFGIGLMITSFMLPEYGAGHHLVTVPPNKLEGLGKINFAYEIVYIPTLALAKLSILALYHRIFRTANKPFTIAVWAIAVYIILWTIGIYLSVFLECQPLHSLWTSTCAPPKSTTISTGVLNIVSDVAIFLLPQPIIWNLQMPLKRKIAISGVFLLGLFATVVSIVRIPLIVDSANQGDADITWGMITTDILTIIEPMTAIICACLPVMQVFYGRLGIHVSGFSSLYSRLRSYRNRSKASSVQDLKDIRDSEDTTESTRQSYNNTTNGSNV